MAQEEFQELKYEVNLLKSKVDTSGRQVDLLLQKLDSTADKLVDLTVTILGKAVETIVWSSAARNSASKTARRTKDRSRSAMGDCLRFWDFSITVGLVYFSGVAARHSNYCFCIRSPRIYIHAISHRRLFV